jgi:hypothetical protein
LQHECHRRKRNSSIVGRGKSMFSYIAHQRRVYSPKSPLVSDNPHVQAWLILIYMALRHPL